MTRCIDPACTDGPREEERPLEPLPRWAKEGVLCPRCATLLEQRIAELPARRDQLRTLLGGRTGGGNDGSKKTKGTPPIPLDLGVHDHLELMHATVVSWVRLVCEDRDLRGPDRDDVAPLSSWLLGQVGWLTQQDWCGDLADEMRDVSRIADSMTRVHAAWHRLPAPCPACGAQELGRWDGADHVQCAACEDSWPEQDYLRLVRVLATDSGTSVTAAEGAERAGVPGATFRQWVSRGHVRRLGTVDGVARYSTADLDALTEERTA